MAMLGHYLLCAAEGANRARDMYTSPAYQRGGWPWVRRQVQDAMIKIARAGGTLDFFVVKYFAGQGQDPVTGLPEPRALDILQARDRACVPDVCGPSPMQGRAGLATLSRWADRQNLLKCVYIGKAPEPVELEELQANPRDLEFVTGWFNALAGLGWKIIHDNASSPVNNPKTLAFIDVLERHGCPRHASEGEAFSLGGGAVARGTFPNVPWSRCWGENDAWASSGLPGSASQMESGWGLLHTAAGATDDVLEAAAAINGMVAMNVNAMSMEALNAVVQAPATHGAPAGE